MDSSRTINHKLNELLSKHGSSKLKLATPTAMNYANTLKTNIMGKDKQEKVNSIVVMAKLLDCVIGTEAASNQFMEILDSDLFKTLLSIISVNMSVETYKAILKIMVFAISGTIYDKTDENLTKYLPIYHSIIEYLEVLDIIAIKVYSPDYKVTLSTIKLVHDLITKAIKFQYSGITTILTKLKSANFFNMVNSLLFETDDHAIVVAVENLKVSYYNITLHLLNMPFDLSHASHERLLNEVYDILVVSLNEYGTPATTEDFIQTGFTGNPKQFMVENFSILLAMNLYTFLRDPNFTFKKRFHEELMMSEHKRTFPFYLFLAKTNAMWLEVIQDHKTYPNIYKSILSWEAMNYYTMHNCLILWQETAADLEISSDIDKIFQLLQSDLDSLESQLASSNAHGNTMSIEECLDISNKLADGMRSEQVDKLYHQETDKWQRKFVTFNKNLNKEVLDFTVEQRVIQLLKGLWVYTDNYGELIFRAKDTPKRQTGVMSKYYYIALSPDRQHVFYKDYVTKPATNPLPEEMEQRGIRIADIKELKSSKVGDFIGEAEKRKNSKLISIRGTISYERISLIGNNNKTILAFYTDTEVNKFVWLDGLKMLMGKFKPEQLSVETTKQIESLIDIRRRTQFLSLEHEDGDILDEDRKALAAMTAAVAAAVASSDEDDSEEDELYDMAELDRVTRDFTYGEANLD